jgi:hypothetical protein
MEKMEAKISKYLPDIDGMLIAWNEGSEFGQLKITYDGKGNYLIDAEYISLERVIKIIQSLKLK